MFAPFADVVFAVFGSAASTPTSPMAWWSVMNAKQSGQNPIRPHRINGEIPKTPAARFAVKPFGDRTAVGQIAKTYAASVGEMKPTHY
jgi:hypothetical protein